MTPPHPVAGGGGFVLGWLERFGGGNEMAGPLLGGAIQDVAMWAGKEHNDHAAAQHPDGTGTPETADALAEIRGALDRARSAGAVSWRLLLMERVLTAFAERNPEQLRAELVNTASMAISWVADLDLRWRLKR